MSRSKTSKSKLGITAIIGLVVTIPFVASTFTSCDIFGGKKSNDVSVAATPQPVPVPVPIPNPGPNPIPGLQNSWVALNSINPPAARSHHSAVWTGTRMIVWGGVNASGYLNDGASLDPQTGTWTTISAVNAPPARASHEAVMINGKMIIYGGTNGTVFYNTAYSYDPATNQWAAQPLSQANPIAARAGHSAVSTGATMLVWGGFSNVQPSGFSDGGYYLPNVSWDTLIGGPPVLQRFGHSSVWTGNSMIMFGGQNNNVTTQDGYIFNPNTNVFTQLLVVANTPSNRSEHSAVWDGQHMLIWGGLLQGITTSYHNDGRAYSLAGNSWLVMNNTGAPTARAGHSAVWAGDAMIVWGGVSAPPGGSPLTYYNNGAVFH